MELKDKTDKQCSAVEVFSLSIKVFVDTFMNYMKNIGTKLWNLMYLKFVSTMMQVVLVNLVYLFCTFSHELFGK
jgi:hypothetical protein